jgi:hypothetical protein
MKSILRLFILLTFVTALTVAIPALQQSVQADKGGIPNDHASPNARGHCVGIECCGRSCGVSVQAVKVETVTV